MSLWLVTNGWRGDGWEGVIVEASDEQSAMDAAAAAFLAADERDAAKWPSVAPAWHVEHHKQRAEQFRERRDLIASEITLPYLGEFG